MSFEKRVLSNWTDAVFYFTHNFLSYEDEVVAGLNSESSEVRCASIAVLNQSSSVKSRRKIVSMLDDKSNKVVHFALEYLWEFGEEADADRIFEFIDDHPFLVSSTLNQIFPNTCGIVNDDDTNKEKEQNKNCWEKALNKNGN